MKSLLLPILLSLTALALTSCNKSDPAPTATAATTTAPVPLKGELIATTAKDDAWVATETAKYPLTVCTVSGDKLGSMGKPIAYIWKEAGKPDRLVLFCCNDCPPDFQKDPAKYLSKLNPIK